MKYISARNMNDGVHGRILRELKPFMLATRDKLLVIGAYSNYKMLWYGLSVLNKTCALLLYSVSLFVCYSFISVFVSLTVHCNNNVLVKPRRGFSRSLA